MRGSPPFNLISHAYMDSDCGSSTFAYDCSGPRTLVYTCSGEELEYKDRGGRGQGKVSFFKCKCHIIVNTANHHHRYPTITLQLVVVV